LTRLLQEQARGDEAPRDAETSRFDGSPAWQGNGSAPTWWPALESWASEGNLHVRVALPGVDPKDVELSVTDSVLTVKGQRKRQGEARDGSDILREFGYASTVD
jgi:HSP20 family molecular chaperone IbpA